METATLGENHRAVSQLFTPILTKRQPRAVRWLRSVLGADSEFLRKNFPSTEVDDFEGRIRNALEKDPGDQASGDILEIARLLKVQPGAPPVKPES